MSVAEKLKALDEAASRPPWHFWGYDPDSKYRDEELIVALRNALPQIVAVVEAAERREDFAAPGVASLVADLDAALTVDGKIPKRRSNQ